MRVVHIPTAVGGNSVGLSSHLKALGVHSEVWQIRANPFGYNADKTLWHPDDGVIRREWKRWKAIWQVARNFDVIHFNFGTTLALPFPYFRSQDTGWRKKLAVFSYAIYSQTLLFLELGLYRIHRRPMFVHYQGDDARQGDYCLTHFEHSIAKYTDKNYYCMYTDRFKRSMIKVMDRNCDQIYAVNPDLLHVLPSRAKFLPYCHISLLDWQLDQSNSSENLSRPLRFGHAPSHRGAKGTGLVLEAVRLLRSEGFKFEFDLVEGLNQEEAKDRYKRFDVLIDQLFVGWYGGLAVEAMALEKPVLVYIRQEDLRLLPNSMMKELPFPSLTPETLVDAMRNMLQMPKSELKHLGKLSRLFVERWHDPLRIARKVKIDYERAIRRSR